MRVAMIAAVGINRVIGIDNELPWYIPEDLKYFRDTTMGKPIIMGRKTFESIGKPLDGRRNIVLTRDASWSFPGVCVARNVKDALALAQEWFNTERQLEDEPECMVIGGAEIYELFLPMAQVLYLTEVHLRPIGDARFPKLPIGRFDRREIFKVPPTEEVPSYCRCVYHANPRYRQIKIRSQAWLSDKFKFKFREPRYSDPSNYANF